MRRTLTFLFLVLAALALGGAAATTEEDPILSETELFPVSPAVNDQRGFAIALDGDWLAIGARLEDLGAGRNNSGAVHLFFLEEGTWKEKASVTSPNPQANGQFGFSVSLRGTRLAVGEPGAGEGAGAAHVFVLSESTWTRVLSVEAAPGDRQLGRSIAIDGEWLAVGEVSPHGDSAGAVHLFRDTGDGWSSLPLLGGDPARPDERFGQSISLRGGILVVGAPGADDSKGAAYVFELSEGAWSRTVRLSDADALEGDQLGYAVATDGEDVVVGAPTAGAHNSGAAWVLHQEDGTWEKLPANGTAGAQLGYAVAIDGNRIAVGAPAPFDGRSGSVHVFTRADGVWSESDLLAGESADPFDVAGSAVAVSGEWVIFGEALGDQGGHAAGSVSSFRCQPGKECEPRGEVAVAGEAAQEVFGISVAADGDFFAVGARGNPHGSVTVFRRASKGFRQEARLTQPGNFLDRFGADVSVAVHRDAADGDLLVIGDPAPPLLGTVFLLRRMEEAWKLEAALSPPVRQSGDEFGRSVATDGQTVVVGARMGADGTLSGGAYAFEKQTDGSWSAGIQLVAPVLPGSSYGVAVAVQGGTIVVGAPHAHGTGLAYLFTSADRTGWGPPVELFYGEFNDKFGTAVAIDGDTVAVGAPRHDAVFVQQYDEDSGAVYVFERSGREWRLRQPLPQGVDEPLFPPGPRPKQGFGSAVALRGKDLVVGAPLLVNFAPVDIDEAYLFHLGETKWHLEKSVDATNRVLVQGQEIPPAFDHFGAGVAIGEGFFVVTSPGSVRGDRIKVFELKREEETP
jgi:hypothetical protein